MTIQRARTRLLRANPLALDNDRMDRMKRALGRRYWAVDGSFRFRKLPAGRFKIWCPADGSWLVCHFDYKDRLVTLDWGKED